MADPESLSSFASVFGRANGVLSPSSSNHGIAALFDFLFTVVVSPEKSALQVNVTDFHSHSWTTELSPKQLSDLRDDIGVGGTWTEYLQFLHSAFASEHVVVQLGGPASAIGGEGATSARLVGRRHATGLKVDLDLSPVPAGQRDDTKGAVAIRLHASHQDILQKLQQEQLRTAQLEQAYSSEKARAEQLQARILGGRHSSRSRRGELPPVEPVSASMAPTMPATARSQDPFSATISQTQGSQPSSPPPGGARSPPPVTAAQPAKRAPAKAGGRPMAKRVRRKPLGTKIGTADEDED